MSFGGAFLRCDKIQNHERTLVLDTPNAAGPRQRTTIDELYRAIRNLGVKNAIKDGEPFSRINLGGYSGFRALNSGKRNGGFRKHLPECEHAATQQQRILVIVDDVLAAQQAQRGDRTGNDVMAPITTKPDVCGGRPRIRDTRIEIAVILDG